MGATALVALVRTALAPWLGTTAPLLVFLVAAFASASLAGLLAGVAATLLSALVGSILFLPPQGEIGMSQTVDQVRIAMFVVSGLLISVGSEAMRRTRRRLERANAATEQAMRERETSLARERAAREQAEALARLRDEFVSTISHELRTPVAAILGFSSLLRQRGEADPASAHMLEVIERNARAEARLIDEMLDLGRILGGRMELAQERIDLRAPVLEALGSLGATARAKNIELAVDPGERPLWVTGDAARLRQVAWSLISNALKFTPCGGRVEVSTTRDPEHARLVVSDTGQGIDPAFLPHVFERFRQADASSTRVHGGLGVGLAVTRHLVELHGGTVTAASEGPGRGARFEVSLPLASAARDASSRDGRNEAPERPSPGEPARVRRSGPGLDGSVTS